MFIHCVALLFVHSVALLLILSPASRCRRCPISRRCRSSPPTVVRALRTPRDPLVEAEAAEKPGVLGLEGERLGLGAKKAERGADQLQHERGQISVTKSLFHRGGMLSLTALAIFMLNTLGRGAAGVAVPPAGFRLVEAACEEVGYIGNSWETVGALVGTQCTLCVFRRRVGAGGCRGAGAFSLQLVGRRSLGGRGTERLREAQQQSLAVTVYTPRGATPSLTSSRKAPK